MNSFNTLLPPPSPFGMLMPNRSWSAVSEYRFGFNGKEGDFETYGEGISYDFGARIYDTRLGRWMSVDPIWFNNAYLTPYHYVDNDPINNIDPNGLEIVEAGLRYGYGINKGNYKPGYLAFARTESGANFLKKFTNGHDTGVFGLGPNEPGSLSNQILEIKQSSNAANAYSQIYLLKSDNSRIPISIVTASDVEKGVKFIFEIVTANVNDPDDANQLGHEAFLHLQYRVEIIEKEILNNLDNMNFESIANKLNEIGKLPDIYNESGKNINPGGSDHRKMANKTDYEYQSFLNELFETMDKKSLIRIKEDNNDLRKKYENQGQ